MNILVICLGNICRSPMGEGFLQAIAERQNVVKASSPGSPYEHHIHSAGLLDHKWGADPKAIKAMKRFGINLSDHRSRQVTTEMLREADLVVTMERSHVRELAGLEPTSLNKTFPLKTLAKLVQEESLNSISEGMPRWVEARKPSDLLGSSAADDIADPWGESQKVFDQTANEIKSYCDSIGPALFA